MQLEFEMSGDKETDANKIRMQYQVALAQTQEAMKILPKDSQAYLQAIQVKSNIEATLANPDDETLLNSVNANKFKEHISNLAHSISYTQEKMSPQALEDLKFQHQQILEGARIASQEKMNNDRINAANSRASLKGGTTQYTNGIEEILDQADSSPYKYAGGQEGESSSFGNSVRITSGIPGVARYITKIESVGGGKYNYYYVDKKIDAAGKKEEPIEEGAVNNVNRDNIVELYYTTNKRQKVVPSAGTPPINDNRTQEEIDLDNAPIE